MRALLVLFLSLLSLGCGSAGNASGDRGGEAGDAAPSDEAAVLEAVFRYQFEHNDSGLKAGAAAYCLCVPGEGGKERDPGQALLDRFKEQKPPAAPCSACAFAEGRVVEKKSGQPALTFYVSRVRWLSAGEAEVEGGYREANLSASGNRYRVVRKDEGWVVADARQQWIS